MPPDVYIAGVGMTKFGKSDRSLPGLMVEAGLRALSDAKLHKIDYVLIGVMSVEEFTGESNIAALITDRLGMPGVPSARIETASSTGSAVFESAFYAVASGYHRNVLIIAGEKMTHLPTARTTKILAEVIDGDERKYGASMPALAAMIAQRYRHDAKLAEKRLESVLSKVAIKNHYNGSLNPYAQFRKVINEHDYANSRLVSYPLRTFDCAPITDGAVAVVLTAEKKLIQVSGLGHATDTLAVRHRDSLTSFRSTRLAAQQAYRMAKVNPKDISFAEVHDAFTPFEIIGTEDLGFFPPKQGWKAVEEGTTSIHGKLPINPSGGLKARGHPVGASGLAQIAEVVWQLRGEMDAGRQLLRELYRPLNLIEAPILVTGIESAELIKYASNAFLATKISFINEMSMLCEQVGADVHAVARGMGLDGRIGKKFLHAGPGYGGSCFPKDTQALVRIAQEHGVSSRIVETVIEVNAAQKARMTKKIREALGGSETGKIIAVLGLTFKPETDDMRDAPSLSILPALLEKGAMIRAHDPQGVHEAKTLLPAGIVYCDKIYDTVEQADALVLLTEWNVYRGLDLERVQSLMNGRVFCDLRNVYEPEQMRAAGFEYVCVGR